MNEGDIALAPVPQADSQFKNRPVVLLRRLPPFGDYLVCSISTQFQHRVPDFDESLSPNDPEFAGSGLRTASIIRLGFLAVTPESNLLGRIGSISSDRHRRLLANLSRHLTAKS